MSFYQDLKKFKTDTALVFRENEIISYENLLVESSKFASKVKNRSLIFILIDNDLESIVALIGSEISNSVIMLLPPNINHKALLKLINLYSPDYIFVNKQVKLKINNFESVYTYSSYELLKIRNFFFKKIDEELLLLQTTSGSTGSPKNVKLSYNNIISNTQSIITDLKISSNDISITTLPPSYVYGLSIINTHLKVGAKIILNKSSVIEKNFWKKLLSNKVNNFGGVPYIYEIILKIGLKDEFFKFLKYSTIAGGHLDNNLKLSLLDFYEKLGISLITMYGAAEATSRMSYLPTEYSRKKNGSIGKPISNGTFLLENENKKIIKKPNCNGELIYKGENVCMGYANSSEDLIKKDVNNSVLRTGDIGYFDKDGFFYIVGKKSRYIKIAGNRISLDEIEKIIYEYGYKNVCSQQAKDTLNIYINKKNIEKKISSYASNYTNLHESLFKVIFIESFPMTKNNKIDYNNKIFKNEN